MVKWILLIALLASLGLNIVLIKELRRAPRYFVDGYIVDRDFWEHLVKKVSLLESACYASYETIKDKRSEEAKKYFGILEALKRQDEIYWNAISKRR